MVALGVAEPVVEAAEIVQVEYHQRQRLVLLAGLHQAQLQLPAQVVGAAQRGQLVEQAMLAEQPFALLHLRADRQLLAVPVVDAEGQQQQAHRHRRRFQPVVPGDAWRHADELVQAVDPPGKEHAGQPQYQQVGDPSRGPAFQHQANPHQRQQRRAALAEDVQPDPLGHGLQIAHRQVQQQAEVGRQQQGGEFQFVELEQRRHGARSAAWGGRQGIRAR
ncbi:hypothetical protein FQZ97_924190 [compost metagenome]